MISQEAFARGGQENNETVATGRHRRSGQRRESKTLDAADLKKQLPLNLVSNVGYFALNIAIGIWMVPYLIKHISTEGYGFIPLASSVTSYVSLITIGLNGAVSRYLVVALHRNDIEGANKILNTSFWALAALALVLVPLSGLFSWLTPGIFNVPSRLTAQVQWLFFVMLLSFIVSVFSAAFSVSTFANNRLDLRNLIDMGNVLVRTTLIVLFFAVLPDSLIVVGIAYLAGGVVSLTLGYLFFRRLTPTLKISPRYFDRSKLREFLSMGGWIVVGQVGTLLFLQIDLILCNILFNAHDTGVYAAIIQWNFLLRNMASVVAVVLSPIVTISYALEQKDRIVRMSQYAVKYMGLGIALPVGLLFGFADRILLVWLGADFVQYAELLRLATFYLTINLAVLPLFSIGTAFNKVKWPGIVTLLTGVIYVFVVIFLAKFLGWGLFGIAAAGFFVLTVKNVVFAPLYFAHVLGIPKTTFFKPLAVGCVATALVSCGAYALSRLVVLTDVFFVALAGAGVAIVYAGIVWGWLLLPQDRQLFVGLITRKGRNGYAE